MNKNSTTQSYNLNATGGNKYAQYFISVGYVGENGLFKNQVEMLTYKIMTFLIVI